MGNPEYRPTTMFVRATENCNADCFMCDYAHLKGRPMLDMVEVKKIAKKSKEAGIKLIRFTGGEPLLDRDVSSYVSYLKEQEFKTSLITNGYLLPFRASSLSEAGLDQVIVSLDGGSEDLHNRLRNTPKLFENAVRGLRMIKILKPDVITRVNTVVSPYNIGGLDKILRLLQDLGIDQWSLMPLKGQNNLWVSENLNDLMREYSNFQSLVSNIDKPRLLGFSKQWAGRSEEEALQYFKTGTPYTPRTKCQLVKLVRFYIPESDKLSACNCVPWRLSDVNLNTNISLDGLIDESIIPLVGYLNRHGPKVCKGCEPANAFLGEHPEILDDDIFSF